MSQNSGQNYNDLLKKLKHTLDNNDKAPEDTFENTSAGKELSTEELQNELKNQFMRVGGVVSPEDSDEYIEDSYKLDDDFLSEAQSISEANKVESEESEVIEEDIIEDIIEDTIDDEEVVEEIVEEIAEDEIIGEEVEEEPFVEAEPIEETAEDDLPWFEDGEASEEVAEETLAEEPADEEVVDEEIIGEETADEEMIEDESTEDSEEVLTPTEQIAEQTEEASISEEMIELAEESYERYEDLDDDDLELVIDDDPVEDFSIWDDEDEEDEDDEEDGDVEDQDSIYLGPTLTESEDEPEDEEEDEVSEIPNKPFIAVLKDNNITFERPAPTPYEAPVDNADGEEEEEEEEISEDISEAYDEDVELYSEDNVTDGDIEDFAEDNGEVDGSDDEDADEADADDGMAASADSSTDLLLQFGYNAHDENSKNAGGFSPDRVRRIKRGYKKKLHSLNLTCIGCVAVTLLMLFYEFLPLIGIEFMGILNAKYYPVSYALIGLQLLAICVALCWKKLWEGIKTLLSFKPDHSSIVAIAIIFTFIYDVVVAICQYTHIPMMFNFLAALSLTVSVLVDLLLLKREMKIFDVYFSENAKYTSVTDGRKASVAEKMYRGGLAPTQNVFVPAEFTPSSAYFRSLDDRRETHKVIYASAIPCIVLALVIWIFGVFFDRGAVESVASAMTVLFSALPLSIVLTDALPLIISGSRLHKRDIALMGVSSIKKFSDCNIMVFRDIHFFEKCEAQNTGMVFYDEGSAHIVFKCLNAIYSELGGPMANVFSKVARTSDAPLDVRFTRISANGTEAIVDGNKAVLVGTPTFMKQYGLNFPVSESSDERSLTLCVSLNGKITAKISVKYKSAGIFEMLAEKLAAEGVYCAIETYDPLINSELINSERIFGDAPISVVHLNLGDLAREKYDEITENKMLLAGEPIGVVAGISRLKLAEALIWSRRIIKTRKKTSRAIMIGGLIGALLSGLIFFLELGGLFNQFSILVYQLLICAASVFITYSTIPPKDYFDIEAFFAQLNAEEESAEDSPEARSDEDSEENSEELPDTDEVEVREEI